MASTVVAIKVDQGCTESKYSFQFSQANCVYSTRGNIQKPPNQILTIWKQELWFVNRLGTDITTHAHRCIRILVVAYIYIHLYFVFVASWVLTILPNLTGVISFHLFALQFTFEEKSY
jgi:hypothetical protein